jgi:hypothetical protein
MQNIYEVDCGRLCGPACKHPRSHYGSLRSIAACAARIGVETSCSYAAPNTLFDGTAEYVAPGLKALGSESAVYRRVTALCALALIVSIRMMPNPSRKGDLVNER